MINTWRRATEFVNTTYYITVYCQQGKKTLARLKDNSWEGYVFFLLWMTWSGRTISIDFTLSIVAVFFIFFTALVQTNRAHVLVSVLSWTEINCEPWPVQNIQTCRKLFFKGFTWDASSFSIFMTNLDVYQLLSVEMLYQDIYLRKVNLWGPWTQLVRWTLVSMFFFLFFGTVVTHCHCFVCTYLQTHGGRLAWLMCRIILTVSRTFET